MSEPVKATEPDPYRKHTVLWKHEEWERLEAAAAKMNAEHRLKLAALDIIRSGAMQRAEEILGAPDEHEERRVADRRSGS